jgi:membrane protein implicated in regulation of membrane protease activity
MMLPWIAVPISCAGLLMGVRGSTTGWWLLAGGIGLLAVDLLITFVWSRRTRERSDQPLLNQRGAQVVGRTVRVVEAIAGGQGKVRIADTVWPVRGPDCAEGLWVKVIAAEGAYLVVAGDVSAPDVARGSATHD